MSKTNIRPSVETIISSGTDRFLFEDLKSSSSRIEQMTQQEQGARVCHDVFSSLFQASPQINPEASATAQQVFSTLLDMPEYKQLTQDTRFDDIASAFGTLQLAPGVLDSFVKMETKREQNKAKQQAEGLGPADSGQGVGPAEGMELSEEDKATLRAALRGSIRAAQAKTEELQDAMSAWGLGEGELKRLSFKEKFDLAQKMLTQSNFKKISELLGRFQNVCNAQESTTFNHIADEIVDIETGSDLSRILPSELIKLKLSPELFFKDMLENNLFQYRMQSTENLGRGPIVCCWDISGSMQGMANQWTKAAVLTLMDLCKKQKRAFGGIAFSDRIHYEKFWPRLQNPTVRDKIDIAEIETTGGTDFNKPLRKALGMIDSSPELKPSDIVFVTDGEANISQDTEAWMQKIRKERGLRVFGIAVASRQVETLKKFCDQIVVLEFKGEQYTLTEINELLKTVRAS